MTSAVVTPRLTSCWLSMFRREFIMDEGFIDGAALLAALLAWLATLPGARNAWVADWKRDWKYDWKVATSLVMVSNCVY